MLLSRFFKLSCQLLFKDKFNITQYMLQNYINRISLDKSIKSIFYKNLKNKKRLKIQCLRKW